MIGGAEQILVTCSFDNAMIVHQIRRSSKAVLMLFAALVLLLTALSALYFYHPGMLTYHMAQLGFWGSYTDVPNSQPSPMHDL